MVQAHFDRYILLKEQARLPHEYDRRCKRERLPLVSARQKGQYAVVEMDLIYVRDAHRFNEDDVFLERIVEACEDAVGDYHQSTYPGLYTSVSRIPLENAETLAQAFLAIYDQSCQIDTELPVFKNIKHGPVRTRLEEAKKVGYCVAHGGADALPVRYRLWCRVNNWPFICVRKRHPTKA